MINKLGAILLICFAFVSQAHAIATVRICCLNDLSVDVSGWTGGAGDVSGSSDDIRVYSSDTDSYSIKIGGAGATMSSGANTLNYKVLYKRSSDITWTELSTNYTSFGDANRVITDCGTCSTINANIKIAVTAAELGMARPGSYSGTLTLIVAPD